MFLSLHNFDSSNLIGPDFYGQHHTDSRELGSVSSFNAVTHGLHLYKYGVTFNAIPSATSTTANRLGLRASIAEPAIAKIRPIKAASGAR